MEKPSTKNRDPLPETDFDGLSLYHPVEHVSKLYLTKHLQAHLHERNTDRWDNTELPNDGTDLFYLTFLEQADDMLEEEGFDRSEFEFSETTIEASLLRVALDLFGKGTMGEFKNRLESVDQRILDSLKVDTPEDIPFGEMVSFRSTISGESADRFSRAAIRAVFAVYRHGVNLPTETQEKYHLNKLDTPHKPSDIDPKNRRMELVSWVRLLIKETIGPLTFEDDNGDILGYLGLFAMSAMSDSGLATAVEVADWDHPRDSIPGHASPPRNIKDLKSEPLYPETAIKSTNSENTDVPSIEEQFDQVHKNTLDLAEDLDLFPDEAAIAIDGVYMPWTADELPYTFKQALTQFREPNNYWSFTVGSIVGSSSRFTIGTRLNPGRDFYPKASRVLLSKISDYINCDGAYADAELLSAEFIEELQNVAGNDFIINAPDDKRFEKFIRLSPTDRATFIGDIPWSYPEEATLIAFPYKSKKSTQGELKPTIKFPGKFIGNSGGVSTSMVGKEPPSQDTLPNDLTIDKNYDDSDILVYPDDINESQLNALPGVGNKNTHATRITGRDIGDASVSGAIFDYFDRKGIEKTMSQLKHQFRGHTESKNELVQLYFTNIAILFQNWQIIINRAPSPNHGYFMEVKSQQLLKAIQYVAFSDPDISPSVPEDLPL